MAKKARKAKPRLLFQALKWDLNCYGPLRPIERLDWEAETFMKAKGIPLDYMIGWEDYETVTTLCVEARDFYGLPRNERPPYSTPNTPSEGVGRAESLGRPRR